MISRWASRTFLSLRRIFEQHARRLKVIGRAVRQKNGKGRAFAERAFDGEVPAVEVDDVFGEVEAEPGAGLVPGTASTEIFLEQHGYFFAWDAAALV